MTARVEYRAKNFGFVGWEAFSNADRHLLDRCVRYEKNEMQKILGEEVFVTIIKI